MITLVTHLKTSLHALHATTRAPRAGVRLIGGEEGAVTAEYGLLLALIALAIIAGALTLGLSVAGMFQTGASGIPNG